MCMNLWSSRQVPISKWSTAAHRLAGRWVWVAANLPRAAWHQSTGRGTCCRTPWWRSIRSCCPTWTRCFAPNGSRIDKWCLEPNVTRCVRALAYLLKGLRSSQYSEINFSANGLRRQYATHGPDTVAAEQRKFAPVRLGLRYTCDRNKPVEDFARHWRKERLWCCHLQAPHAWSHPRGRGEPRFFSCSNISFKIAMSTGRPFRLDLWHDLDWRPVRGLGFSWRQRGPVARHRRDVGGGDARRNPVLPLLEAADEEAVQAGRPRQVSLLQPPEARDRRHFAQRLHPLLECDAF